MHFNIGKLSILDLKNNYNFIIKVTYYVTFMMKRFKNLKVLFKSTRK